MRLLIFAYAFPPANFVGATRPYAMARYFADRGWQVTVVSGSPAGFNDGFAADLSGIRVSRARDPARVDFLNVHQTQHGALKYLRAGLRALFTPDIYGPAARRMVEMAGQIIARDGRPDLILATAPPFSMLVAAGKYAARHGIPFVADNRDVWANSPYRRTAPFYRPFERRVERAVLSRARLVTVISQKMADHYAERHPILRDRLFVVRNGTDSALGEASRESAPAPSDPRALTITYTGILYGGKRDLTPLFLGVASSSARCRLVFYGAEADVVASYAKRFPSLEIVNRGRVARAEAIAAQASSDCLVVALGTDTFENQFLPGKFFEYVASGRPILALCDRESEIAALVRQYDLGMATRDPADIARFIRSLTRGDRSRRGTIPSPLTRSYQLSRLHEKLLEMIPTLAESELNRSNDLNGNRS